MISADGFPLIGALGVWDNVYINTAHGINPIINFACAELLVNILTGNTANVGIIPAAFSLQRFFSMQYR